MHVLQVSGFPPTRIGGTEIYIAELVRGLAARGLHSTLVVPRGVDETLVAEHAGAPVETYPVSARPTADELQTGAPHQGFEEFRRLLARHPGAVYHQHSWTRGCGAEHLRAARQLGMRTVLTVHTPSNFCMRGDMMRFGEVACDGRIGAVCANCWSQQRGAPKPLARALSKMPLAVSRAARRREGRLFTALSARALADCKARDLHEMAGNCDRIVAVCDWVHDVLILNGVPPGKICLSRQGVSEEFEAAIPMPRRGPGGPLKLLYLGSWNPLKGVDVVVRAIRSLFPDIDARLVIHAPRGGPVEYAYEQSVRALANGDARITFRPPVVRDALAATMAEHDVLVIPSVSLETGPLVALEGQAAGMFVMGSRLGGIAELVQDGNGGMLLEPGDVPAWAAAIREVAERHRREGLPAHAGPVRQIRAVSDEMAALYHALMHVPG